MVSFPRYDKLQMLRRIKYTAYGWVREFVIYLSLVDETLKN